LDRLLAPCKNERERFTMLTWWVARLWPHCHYWPWPPREQRWIFWKRGHELLPDIQAGRTGGMCGGYAHVMEELFWSLGYEARRIQVSGHSSFEAYLNEQDRWIICDASFNQQAHLLADPQGRFLGCADLIRRFEALEHDPKALKEVRQLICCEENLAESQVTPTNPVYGAGPLHAYDHLGVVIDKTHELGRTRSACRSSAMAWYFRACERSWKQAEIRRRAGGAPQRLVRNLDDLIPSRNRAAVTLAWRKPSESLTVAAQPAGVSFFENLLASVDGGPERPVSRAWLWRLHPGLNSLAVRTQNRFGVRGYPFRIRLWKQP